MKDFKLYAITCSRQDVSYEKQIKQAISGGADIVQLRAGDIADKEFIGLAEKIKSITKRYKVPFIINNRLDIALIVGADGVHLGQDDMPVKKARMLIKKSKKKSFVMGVSTHSLRQAIEAQQNGADYISVGPVFPTPTKPEYKSVGLDLIKRVKKKIKIPFVAIGGINQSNLMSVIGAGAGRVAVVREICGARNIKKAACQMKDKIDKILG